MKCDKQTIMAVFGFFAAAYVLTIMGCSKSEDISGKPRASETALEQTTPTPPPHDASAGGPDGQAQTGDLTTSPQSYPQSDPQSNSHLGDATAGLPPAVRTAPLDIAGMRECDDVEYANLVEWSDDLAAAIDAIRSAAARTPAEATELSLTAIEKCDQAEKDHAQNPCKKTIPILTMPDHPVVRVYDSIRIQKKCQPIDRYLTQLHRRPQPPETTESAEKGASN